MSCTLAHALGDARQLADDGKLGLQADVDRAHDLLDARDRRAAQQHDRRGNAAVAQPADVLEAQLGDPDDAAAQHGARHLRHAAGPLGDAEHLDAGSRAAFDDRSGIALDAAEIDGDLRSGHFLPRLRNRRAGRPDRFRACGRRPGRREISPSRPPWSSRHGRGRCRGRDCWKRARPITGTEFGIIGLSPAQSSALLLVERAREELLGRPEQRREIPRPVAAVEAGEFGGRGKPQPVAEPRIGDQPVLVDAAHGRPVDLVFQRHGRGVALDRIDRQVDAVSAAEQAAFGSHRDHHRVAAHRPRRRPHRADAVAVDIEPLDRRAEQEFDAELVGCIGREPLREQPGIAGLVHRRINAAGDLVLRARPARARARPAGCGRRSRSAGRGRRDSADCRCRGRGSAASGRNTGCPCPLVIVDAGLGGDLVDAVARIERQPQFHVGVGAAARRRALR